MAKKRRPKTVEAVAEPKLQPVRVDLEPEIHDLLRIEAARERMSMARFARTIITQAMRERAQKEK